MPAAELSVSNVALEPAVPSRLARQLAAERTMVRSVIIGILAALPITIAVTIGLIGVAISDQEPWYVWIGLGAGIGTYAAGFFGTCAGVMLSSHRFDELDEDASHLRHPPPAVAAVGDLRPLERRVSKLAADGMVPAEIGRRFHRSEQFVERVLVLADLPGRSVPEPRHGLRPIERCLLRWRSQGVSTSDIANRFRRGPGYIEQVLELADYKQQQS